MQVFLEGVGVRGPGLSGWSEICSIFSGAIAHDSAQTLRYEGKFLPANERRRASEIVRLSLDVGFEALSDSATAANSVATVFATSGGDGHAVHEICAALATQQREVSPTRFHNSVHNAPAGYWNIAAQSQQPSTSVSGYDATFAVGLLEAATLALSRNARVLLVTCDMAYPFPLSSRRPLPGGFATALLLAPAAGSHTVAELSLALTAESADDTRLETFASLEALRASIPAARALPLLHNIAAQRAAKLSFALHDAACLAVTTRYA